MLATFMTDKTCTDETALCRTGFFSMSKANESYRSFLSLGWSIRMLNELLEENSKHYFSFLIESREVCFRACRRAVRYVQ